MKTYQVCFRGCYRSPLYAVHALVQCGYGDFILFRGRCIQRIGRGFRAEIQGGKWSRTYREPLRAIEQALPCPSAILPVNQHPLRTHARTHARKTSRLAGSGGAAVGPSR